jgi:hypothetical protein
MAPTAELSLTEDPMGNSHKNLLVWNQLLNVQQKFRGSSRNFLGAGPMFSKMKTNFKKSAMSCERQLMLSVQKPEAPRSL